MGEILEFDSSYELFKKYYDVEKKHMLNMKWYGTKIENSGKCEVDFVLSSRKLKNFEKSPSDCLFRTHQYEIFLKPNDDFFEWSGDFSRFFVEVKLFRETSKKDHVFEEYIKFGQPVIQNTYIDKNNHWIVILDLSNAPPTRKTNEVSKISYRGNFCLKVIVFKRENMTTYTKLFERISSDFQIVSKPGVYLRRKKVDFKKKNSSSSSSTQKNKKLLEVEEKMINIPPSSSSSNLIKKEENKSFNPPLLLEEDDEGDEESDESSLKQITGKKRKRQQQQQEEEDNEEEEEDEREKPLFSSFSEFNSLETPGTAGIVPTPTWICSSSSSFPSQPQQSSLLLSSSSSNENENEEEENEEEENEPPKKKRKLSNNNKTTTTNMNMSFSTGVILSPGTPIFSLGMNSAKGILSLSFDQSALASNSPGSWDDILLSPITFSQSYSSSQQLIN